MDALWPDLTVTEASLQRAVSLARRRARRGRAGDGDPQLRPARLPLRRSTPGPRAGRPEGPTDDADAAPTARRLRPGARLVRRRARASRRLRGRATLTPGGHRPLGARRVEMPRPPGRCDSAPRPRGRRPTIDAGQPVRAARAAVTLAKIELERGAAAVAGGWLDRAESLLGERRRLPATRAYLLWMRSRLATFGGDAEEALELASPGLRARRAVGRPRAAGADPRLQGLLQPVARPGRRGQRAAEPRRRHRAVERGRPDHRQPRLLQHPLELPHLRRLGARLAVERGLRDLVRGELRRHRPAPATCTVPRSSGRKETLAEALERIDAALVKLVDEEAWSLGEGYRVRGDIHAMIGDLDAARADYAAAYAIGWDAEPGNAVLLFESGDADAALAALDRALAGRSWFHLQRRGYLLVNTARIAALGGRPETATAGSSPRSRRARRAGRSPAIRALLAETRAALCARRRRGDAAAAPRPPALDQRRDRLPRRARPPRARPRLTSTAGDPPAPPPSSPPPG